MQEQKITRQKSQIASLNLFSHFTGLPIILCEIREEGKYLFHYPTSINDTLPEYCRTIKTFYQDNGDALVCNNDIIRRLNLFVNKESTWELNSCHAGLWNLFIKHKIDDDVRAIFILGKVIINKEENKKISLKIFNKTISKLAAKKNQIKNLESSFHKVHEESLENFLSLKKDIFELQSWFYSNLAEDRRLKRITEKISHELQTRLQGIIAVSENLHSGLSNLDQSAIKTGLKNVVYSSFALSTVIHNIGKSFLGGYNFHRAPLRPLLEESARIYRLEAERANIVIRLDIVEYNWGVEFSEEHIKIAFNNLVHNAVKYSFRGQQAGDRYVLIKGRPKNDAYYELTFQNYGVGILKEEIDSGAIFRDSYQGELTEHEFRTGSGMGLYYVKQVIDRHHGTVEVISEKKTDEEGFLGKPHKNIFVVRLPYLQPDGVQK